MQILQEKQCLGCGGAIFIYKMSCPSLQAIQDRKKYHQGTCATRGILTQKMQDPNYRKAYSEKIKVALRKSETAKKLQAIPQRQIGIQSPYWKDNTATYSSKHRWIQRHWKRKGICEFCGTVPPPRRNGHSGTEWSNISGTYDRNDRKDWQELCNRCHKLFDKTQRADRGGIPIDTKS